jgi:hypothetical protein
MKKIFIILLLGTLTVVSCKKPVEPVPPHKDTFSAQVNGKPFFASTISAGVDTFSTGRPLGIMVTDVYGPEIWLTISGYDGVKTSFNLGDYNTHTYGTFILQDMGIFSDFSISKSGQFNIDSFDKITYKPHVVITSTFHFETDDPFGKYSITDGHFSLLLDHQ